MNEKLFIDNWISKIQTEGIKQFPFHFIDETQLDIISIPIKTLVVGQEFFGAYEIITTNGEQVYQASTSDEAKFFVYSSKQRDGKAYLPKDKSMISKIVSLYNNYLDELIDKVKVDYKKLFPDGKNFLNVSNEIFQKLNLIRY
ncbi:MAG: hypothetical protein WAR59_04720 [Ignavibacteriaceae bacterium]